MDCILVKDTENDALKAWWAAYPNDDFGPSHMLGFHLSLDTLHDWIHTNTMKAPQRPWLSHI